MLGLLFVNFYGYGNYSEVDTDQLSEFSISGVCENGISNLYVTENYNYDLFGSGNYNFSWTKGTTVNNLNMTLASLHIKVTDLRDSPYSIIITDNITNAKFAVPQTVFNAPRARIAQYFELDNLTLIQKIWIFLNCTIGGLFPAGTFQVDIYNASNLQGGPLNENSHSTKRYVDYVGWDQIAVNEYFEAGAYYAVFTSWVEAWLFPSMNNNSWCIHKYAIAPSTNKPSLFENLSGWFPIPEDIRADFLLKFNVTHYSSPYEVNLRVSINDQPIQLNHKRDYTVKSNSWGKPVWISEIMFYLEEPPTLDQNISITMNKSTTFRIIETKGRYIYEKPATGTFIANLTSFKWDIHYQKINSSSSLLVFLQYPRDWRVSKFLDAFGFEIIEYGIYYSYVYGVSKTGIYYEEGGDGSKTFDYSATFTSPNYIAETKLYTKPLFSNLFSAAGEVYSGEPFKLQATIKNSEGALITTGNCSFYLFNPNEEQIYSCNKTNPTGIISSDEINTQGWTLGTYSMIVYWTNGGEYGLSIYYISFSISPMLITLIIAIVVAASTVVVLTYGRRKLAERNWIKSIHHVIVLSKKDGRPMYNYSFGVSVKDTALLSGMLSAITDFVKETTGSEKLLRVIDQEDKKIILSHGMLTTVAILANKDLRIIHNSAKAFLQSFEAKYGGKLQGWTGNVDMFKGAGKLVEDHFPITMEQKLINKCGFQLQELKAKVESAEDKATIAEILSATTTLTQQYQDLILKHYNDLIKDIIKIANEKLSANG